MRSCVHACVKVESALCSDGVGEMAACRKKNTCAEFVYWQHIFNRKFRRHRAIQYIIMLWAASKVPR